VACPAIAIERQGRRRTYNCVVISVEPAVGAGGAMAVPKEEGMPAKGTIN